ncbi:hypothetical protein HK099_003561 [Clydaea vesicula]|uniref:Uncharacterized protein n=1 Tax=Clydaea vesicula TaxID=447962 RepID=A0AAD5U1P0_9FUNG|nr:hypothetical protein HK099_003561 [Clydaea vesicula]
MENKKTIGEIVQLAHNVQNAADKFEKPIKTPASSKQRVMQMLQKPGSGEESTKLSTSRNARENNSAGKGRKGLSGSRDSSAKSRKEGSTFSGEENAKENYMCWKLLSASQLEELEGKTLEEVFSSFNYFKNLLLSHSTNCTATMNSSGETQGGEIFGPKEVQLITNFAFSTMFQHFNLIMQVWSTEQEEYNDELFLLLEDIPEVFPLQESITYEEHNEIQRKLQEEEEICRLEEEKRMAEEKAARVNPFEALDNETIKQITSETIRNLLSDVNEEFENLFEGQKDKILAQLNKIVGIKE